MLVEVSWYIVERGAGRKRVDHLDLQKEVLEGRG